MVMTLRKRVPPPKRSPSPEREIIVSRNNNKRARKVPKPSKGRPRSGKRILLTESESELESESESDSEKENGGGVPTGYESIREQRMRENRERMEKLGIFSLSSQMFNSKKKPTKNPPQKRKRYPSVLPRPPRVYEPRRSSDRLKDVARGLETERSLKEMGISIPDGWKAEVYTEEDEKLLGDCETKWKLEVDGYGEDGDLMYDPVTGTSCHQCRYKTARKHTFCSKCRLPRGQLCGDCLYTRYGENVLEATQNPTWLCPACRGICNCSRCRQEKGWSRFTIPYAKVIEAGFKSVAHYLILNRNAVDMQKKSENGTLMVDLTEQETQASMQYDCSDKSDDWSESDSDDSDSDDDSQAKKKNTAQSIEKQVDIAVPETFNEAACAADKNGVLQELNC